MGEEYDNADVMMGYDSDVDNESVASGYYDHADVMMGNNTFAERLSDLEEKVADLESKLVSFGNRTNLGGRIRGRKTRGRRETRGKGKTKRALKRRETRRRKH